MSAPARWIIALFAFLSGCAMLWVFVIRPAWEAPPSARAVAIGFPVVCFAITAACIPGAHRPWVFRFLGGTVFLIYLGYAIEMIGQPLFPGGRYRQSDTSLINALLGLFIFGLPGAYVAITGHLPLFRDAQSTAEESNNDDDET